MRVYGLSAYGRVPKGERDGGLARLQKFGAAVVVLRLPRARYRWKAEIGSFPVVFSARPAEQYFGATATQIWRKFKKSKCNLSFTMTRYFLKMMTGKAAGQKARCSPRSV